MARHGPVPISDTRILGAPLTPAPNGRFWHIASFGCDAEFDRLRSIADIDRAAPVKLDRARAVRSFTPCPARPASRLAEIGGLRKPRLCSVKSLYQTECQCCGNNSRRDQLRGATASCIPRRDKSNGRHGADRSTHIVGDRCRLHPLPSTASRGDGRRSQPSAAIFDRGVRRLG